MGLFSPPDLIVMQNETRRMLVLRPRTHAAALETCQRYFPHLIKSDIEFQTSDLDVCKGQMAGIAPEIWPLIVRSLSTVVVHDHTRPDQIYARQCEAGRVSVALTDPIIPSRPVRAVRKPVIYFFSPTDIDASVSLTLVPEWTFCAIYPVVPIKKSTLGDGLQWNVHVRPDGSMTETNTGLDVTYLFWEARTSEVPPSTKSLYFGTLETDERFNPCSPDIRDSNSVLVAVKDITPYLDEALGVLGLHTEARTSFITYWLPDLLKHKHVALRFLPQAAYERAAPLNIIPQPDIVTRVFMLFKGVAEDHLVEWPQSFERYSVGGTHWTDVVGVDTVRVRDTQLFRVLEWGGMEVLDR